MTGTAAAGVFEVRAGEPQPGYWCDLCRENVAVLVPVEAREDDGIWRTMGHALVCVECGSGLGMAP